MDRQILNFTANEQVLTVDNPIRISTNKVNYIEAHFALGDNWSGYDSVRAVWFNDYQTISTVLDSQGVCRVPFEVMKRKGKIQVDLVGSISENDVLTDRLTSYPVVAVVVDCIAQITGAETNPITPSQFEQYVAIVRDLVDSVKDIDYIELNDDYTLTIYYSDGTSYTTTSIRGEQGADGNGIASVELNPDYTLTITYTDGTSYTTTSIRGEKGEKGEQGEVSQAQLDAAVSDLKSEISDIEEITIKTTEHTETTDITSDLTFTDGYMNTSGQTGASNNYKYTNKISVAEGDVILSGNQDYNLRYITAYNGNTVESAKGADSVFTYTVPSGIDSVVVTIYSAVGTTSNAILHTATVIERENILDDTIDTIEGEIDSVNDRVDVIESLTIIDDVDVVTTDLTSTLTFTDGFVDTDGNIGSSANYKYTEHISVSEGDIIFTTSDSYSLRYITAYNDNNVEPSKSSSNVLTYTVPSGVDSVIVTVYSATDLVAGTVEKTVTTVETRNINDEVISEIKNNTIYERTNSTDITASLTFTNGYVNKQGLVVSGSSTYKYSTKISVSEGDVFSTAEYPFRYVTAYNGTAIEAKSAEAVMSYTVPSGISEVILTMYIASTRGVMKGVKEPYNLFYNSLSQKNVGYFEKPYICLSCDDGADELATYTIPMIISKGVPCTFGLYKTSPVFQHGYTQTVVNAVNNNNCEVAQHGGQHSWTDYNAEELVAFFDDEELFWKNIGVDVKSAIYPTHLSNPMVRAITGSRFGCCRSGYNYDGILYYDDESKPSGTLPYYGTGARSNLYAMASWNMPAGKDLQFAKNCIDWAIANNKLIHFYWHDWDLDSVSKQVLEDTIDYAKTQNINFIKLSEVPYIK